ncbi:MAG: AI-2E family transporter [Defluviitaleaceae bacterium]|nr:AI-2E family transporter [Defluviitaleaceae bacterium]
MTKSPLLEKLKSLIPYFLLALAIIIAYRITGALNIFIDFFRLTWGVILPFFYGFILAYIINIPCSGIQKLLSKSTNKFVLKRKKMLSILIVFLIVALIVFLTLNLIVPAISDSVSFFFENVHIYWASIMGFIDYINGLGLFEFNFSPDEIINMLGDLFANFSMDTLMAPINAVMGAATAAFSGVIALISSIYILVEKDRCKAYIDKLLRVFTSDGFRTVTISIFSGLNQNFRQYIRTQTIDGIILGTIAAIILFLLDSPYALILGIMLGIVNYIPYFGSIFGTLIAVFVVVLTQGLGIGVIAAALLFVAQQIDANIIQPRLMSGSFSLSPLLVIISISIGGAISGIFGMIVAIPIVAVLKDIFDSIVAHYEHKKFGALGDKEVEDVK